MRRSETESRESAPRSSAKGSTRWLPAILFGVVASICLHLWAGEAGQEAGPTYATWLAAGSLGFAFCILLYSILTSRSREELKHDPISGLLGKERLADALRFEVARADRLGLHVGVVTADLTFEGHFGIPQYRAWRAVARTLRHSIRLSDGVYALSHGRFALLLSATNPEGCDRVIRRLRALLRGVPELEGTRVGFGKCLLEPAYTHSLPPAHLLAYALGNLPAARSEHGPPAKP